MKIWQTEVNLKLMTDRGNKTMSDYLGIEFNGVGEDYITARMPVDDHTKQPFGIMHGGASCVLAETLASTAAQFCVDFDKQYCVGLDINTNHVRSIKSGYVNATARPFHLGKRTQVWGIEIRDDENNLISVTRMTMAVLNK